MYSEHGFEFVVDLHTRLDPADAIWFCREVERYHPYFVEDPLRAEYIEGYEHVVRLWTVVLEISVLMAQFPSKQIAELSYQYRTLGLGYANIGGLLMTSGIPYDSDAGRAIGGALSAIMTGISYAT